MWASVTDELTYLGLTEAGVDVLRSTTIAEVQSGEFSFLADRRKEVQKRFCSLCIVFNGEIFFVDKDDNSLH